MSSTLSSSAVVALPLSQRLILAVGSCLLGAALIFVAGFAPRDAVHNAPTTPATRTGFPCTLEACAQPIARHPALAGAGQDVFCPPCWIDSLMFKRIAQTAGFAGLLAAIVLTLLQSLWVTPLIIQAEGYETSAPQSEHAHAPLNAEHAADSAAHDHAPAAAAEHHHDTQAWSPEDGWQRSHATGLSNLVVAVGLP